MTRMFEEGLELRTTSRRPAWSPSSVLCLWDSMRDGIRSSSTFLILREEPTERTTLKLYEFRFTRIVVSAASTSPTVFTPRKSFLRNSSSSSQLRSRIREPPERNKLGLSKHSSWSFHEEGTVLRYTAPCDSKVTPINHSWFFSSFVAHHFARLK